MYLAILVLESSLTAVDGGAARCRVAPVATGACAYACACARERFECFVEVEGVVVDVDEVRGAVLSTADLDERVFQLAVLRSAMDYAAMRNGDRGTIVYKSVKGDESVRGPAAFAMLI